MKTPRIHDFDPDAAERQLSTPLDNMPAIEKPRPRPPRPVIQPTKVRNGQRKKVPVLKPTRRYVRRTFDYFEDQIEYLTRVSLEERLAGRNVTMASMLREALDRYITEKSSNIRWVESTAMTDSWDCRECGWTWVIEVALAEETIRN